MTTPEWRCKRGDDFYAPAPIVVKVGGVAQDLTDPDWEIAIQARSTPEAADVAFTPTWDTDPALLEAGEIWLILDRDTTREPRGTYYLDLQVTNDTLPKVKRKTSEVFSITFVDTATWTDDEEGS